MRSKRVPPRDTVAALRERRRGQPPNRVRSARIEMWKVFSWILTRKEDASLSQPPRWSSQVRRRQLCADKTDNDGAARGRAALVNCSPPPSGFDRSPATLSGVVQIAPRPARGCSLECPHTRLGSVDSKRRAGRCVLALVETIKARLYHRDGQRPERATARTARARNAPIRAGPASADPPDGRGARAPGRLIGGFRSRAPRCHSGEMREIAVTGRA